MCDIQKIKDNTTISDMDFTNCDMKGLVIQDKTFTKCKFNKVNLTNAKLKNIKFIEINFEGVKFVSAKLEDVSFKNCVFSNTDFTTAKMKKVSLINAKLMGSNLTGAELEGAELGGADMEGADLKAANLAGANLKNANLKNASLMNADLMNANLTDADLMNANLVGADMEDAILTGAILTGVNLKGANLKGVDLTGVDLTGVDLTFTVITPNGVLSGEFEADLSNDPDIPNDFFNGIKYDNNDNFSGLVIEGKTCIACVFSDVNINQTTFTSTTFKDCVFSNIHSKNSSFLNCTFNNCSFLFNTMSAASFSSSIFEKVNFDFCYLHDPDFSNVDLRTIIFTGGNFRNFTVASQSTVVAIDKIKYTNQGYNPLTKGKENVTRWLKNKDNVVFIIDGNDTPMCVCRDSFDESVTPMNYIMHSCEKKDKKYAKKIIKSKTNSFLDLGMLNLIDGAVTNLHNFTQILKKGQIFSIRKESESKLSVYNGDLFIKMNDFHNTFKEYSGSVLYESITKYFISGKTPTESVLRHISIMDQYFMEHVKRTKDNKTVLYRGMDRPYDIAMGESMIVHNYISTTTQINIMYNFSHKGYYKETKNVKPPHLPDDVNNCCAYELTLDEGIPYVNMEFSSHIPHEQEVLLPRNLLITLTGEYINSSKKHIRQLRISKSTENQFESIPQERCSTYNYANVDVSQIGFVDSFWGRGGSRHRKNKTKKNKTKKIKKR